MLGEVELLEAVSEDLFMLSPAQQDESYRTRPTARDVYSTGEWGPIARGDPWTQGAFRIERQDCAPGRSTTDVTAMPRQDVPSSADPNGDGDAGLDEPAESVPSVVDWDADSSAIFVGSYVETERGCGQGRKRKNIDVMTPVPWMDIDDDIVQVDVDNVHCVLMVGVAFESVLLSLSSDLLLLLWPKAIFVSAALVVSCCSSTLSGWAAAAYSSTFTCE